MTKARFLIILSFLLLLSGCGAKAETPSEPEGTPLEIAAEIVASQPDLPPLEFLTPDSDAFTPYLTQIYGIAGDGFLDGVIGYAGGSEASEIAVLVFSDEAAAQSARAALLDYRTFRADSFTGYVPDQAALAEGGTAVCQGQYTALLLCADTDGAKEAFQACFEPGWEPTAQPVDLALAESSQTPAADTAEIPAESTEAASEPAAEPDEREPESPADTPAQDGEDAEEDAPGANAPASETEDPLPSETAPTETVPADATPSDAASASTPPSDTASADASEEAEDNYDHDAVLSAWHSGDPSGLSEKNRAVYDAAQSVISQVITSGMTPYQKELAIHDYITAHAHYDQEANSNAPDAAPDPDNDNPYGLLISGAGICYGYVSTFQLFMDMLDIECISVSGRGTNREHGWNMVRLDNDWYCVDVTWDDPTGGTPLHRYFNVTSQVMRQTNHEWNRGSIPEATSTRWAYRG